MAQRLSRRIFPDVLQAGLVADLIIPQSRITFSGPTGLVLFFYQGRIINAGAALINELQVRFVANVNIASLRPWIQFLPGGIGIDVEYTLRGFALDPPAGGFVEVEYVFSVGSVDFPALGSNYFVLSFPTEEGGGPLVTIA